mmetsp:Transcript_28130/g.76057  ORF Transcript_28130/g.76057 Transcript_28130/m.76057 type:complete len:145 (+) Transcript_28130:100-534(+)|eukprot:6533531-Prymnesium_polylepis.1
MGSVNSRWGVLFHTAVSARHGDARVSSVPTRSGGICSAAFLRHGCTPALYSSMPQLTAGWRRMRGAAAACVYAPLRVHAHATMHRDRGKTERRHTYIGQIGSPAQAAAATTLARLPFHRPIHGLITLGRRRERLFLVDRRQAVT